jgi:hypothetical protein
MDTPAQTTGHDHNCTQYRCSFTCHGDLRRRPIIPHEELCPDCRTREAQLAKRRMEYTGLVVWVRRQWNDLRLASYPLEDIVGVQWGYISGGIQVRTPRDFLMGYVWCDAMLQGELAHSCAHGRKPHQIKICIMKKGNERTVFEILAAQVRATK